MHIEYVKQASTMIKRKEPWLSGIQVLAMIAKEPQKLDIVKMIVSGFKGGNADVS